MMHQRLERSMGMDLGPHDHKRNDTVYLADLNQGSVQFLLTIHVDNNNKFVHVSTATMLTNQRTN